MISYLVGGGLALLFMAFAMLPFAMMAEERRQHRAFMDEYRRRQGISS